MINQNTKFNLSKTKNERARSRQQHGDIYDLI